MAILNVTPDSFSDGGEYAHPDAAVRQGVEMVQLGADLLDVGGESTRPGATPVSLAEELRRVIPVIEQLATRVRVPISVDTSKAEVARQAMAAGASIVNDISAMRHDPHMAEVVARGKANVILMHMRGTPQTMQRRPRYRDVVQDVADFLAETTERAYAAGIARACILIDPGLGFGKTVRQNLQLMDGLECLGLLGYPVVVGPSRKSFIGTTLNADVQDRVVGTLACVAAAYQRGVSIVRVHDVLPTVHMIRMLRAIEEAHATRR